MATNLSVTAVEARPDRKIWVRFEDGVEGEVDVSHLQDLSVFSHLKDDEEFNKVYVHPELRLVCWGEDFEIAPCRLYHKLTTGQQPERTTGNAPKSG